MMSAGPLQNIRDANKPLRMLETLRLLEHPGHTKAALSIIVCETLTVADIPRADFCDRLDETLRPEQKLVELDSDDCITIVRKPKGRARGQPYAAGWTFLFKGQRRDVTPHPSSRK